MRLSLCATWLRQKNMATSPTTCSLGHHRHHSNKAQMLRRLRTTSATSDVHDGMVSAGDERSRIIYARAATVVAPDPRWQVSGVLQLSDDRHAAMRKCDINCKRSRLTRSARRKSVCSKRGLELAALHYGITEDVGLVRSTIPAPNKWRRFRRRVPRRTVLDPLRAQQVGEPSTDVVSVVREALRGHGAPD